MKSTQTHISDKKLRAELKAKYAPLKPLIWKKGIPESRGANVSIRK